MLSKRIHVCVCWHQFLVDSNHQKAKKSEEGEFVAGANMRKCRCHIFQGESDILRPWTSWRSVGRWRWHKKGFLCSPPAGLHWIWFFFLSLSAPLIPRNQGPPAVITYIERASSREPHRQSICGRAQTGPYRIISRSPQEVTRNISDCRRRLCSTVDPAQSVGRHRAHHRRSEVNLGLGSWILDAWRSSRFTECHWRDLMKPNYRVFERRAEAKRSLWTLMPWWSSKWVSPSHSAILQVDRVAS